MLTFGITRSETTQTVMAAKLIRLTHKIEIQLHLVAQSLPFAVLAPGGQSGNFWIYRRILKLVQILNTSYSSS
jgi:hypothetical protein